MFNGFVYSLTAQGQSYLWKSYKFIWIQKHFIGLINPVPRMNWKRNLDDWNGIVKAHKTCIKKAHYKKKHKKRLRITPSKHCGEKEARKR
jgi:hypothetical protein